jgi:hypothetical protein
MTDNCGKCKFFKDQSITKKKSGIGWCRRYPDQGEADDWKWCGEFLAKSKKNTKGMVSFNLGAPLKPETERIEELKAALNESLTKARNDALKKARNTPAEGE